MIYLLIGNETSLYKRNVCIIKKVGNRYKLISLKQKKIAGWELIDCNKEEENKSEIQVECDYLFCERSATKMNCNISRAKTKVYELACCNDWQYFMTFTLNKEKYDRYDLDKYKKDLSIFIRNQRQKYKTDIKYLFVPEQHKDGAWHIHGLLNNIVPEQLESFGEGVPDKLKGYLNYPDYQKKFGFCSLGEIRNKDAVAGYIVKYIAKDIAKNNMELENNLYYCSQGLKRAEKVYEGSPVKLPSKWDYENDYVSVKWFNECSLDYIKNFINGE